MNTNEIKNDLKNVKNVEDLKKLHWGYSIVAAIVLIIMFSVPPLRALTGIAAGAALVIMGYIIYQNSQGKTTKVKWWWMLIVGVALALMLYYPLVSGLLILALFIWGGYGAYQANKDKLGAE